MVAVVQDLVGMRVLMHDTKLALGTVVDIYDGTGDSNSNQGDDARLVHKFLCALQIYNTTHGVY